MNTKLEKYIDDKMNNSIGGVFYKGTDDEALGVFSYTLDFYEKNENEITLGVIQNLIAQLSSFFGTENEYYLMEEDNEEGNY